MFDVEQREYEMRRAEWSRAHGGEHVVLDGTRVIGFFEDLGDAMAAGARELRRLNFFVSPPLTAEPRLVHAAGMVAVL